MSQLCMELIWDESEFVTLVSPKRKEREAVLCVIMSLEIEGKTKYKTSVEAYEQKE